MPSEPSSTSPSRKQLEDLLRERADLLELATEAIFVRDSNGVSCSSGTAGAEDLYGWKREEVLGKNIHDILKTEFPAASEQSTPPSPTRARWDGNLTQHHARRPRSHRRQPSGAQG